MCEDAGERAFDALMTKYIDVVAQRNRALEQLREAQSIAQQMVKGAQNRRSTDTNQWPELYESINDLMAHLGADGKITATDHRADRVMNALFDIDGGIYSPTITTDSSD